MLSKNFIFRSSSFYIIEKELYLQCYSPLILPGNLWSQQPAFLPCSSKRKALIISVLAEHALCHVMNVLYRDTTTFAFSTACHQCGALLVWFMYLIGALCRAQEYSLIQQRLALGWEESLQNPTRKSHNSTWCWLADLRMVKKVPLGPTWTNRD